MNTIFKTYDTFLEEYKNYSRNECEECKSACKVNIEPLKIIIEDRIMKFKDLPVLKCMACGQNYFTYYSKQMIDG